MTEKERLLTKLLDTANDIYRIYLKLVDEEVKEECTTSKKSEQEQTKN